METPLIIDQAIIDSTPVRKPILDSKSEVQAGDEMDRQWGLVTESVRRMLPENDELRKALTIFLATPVSESLPREFLELVALYVPLAARLVKRYEKSLTKYAQLSAVPEELITPDVTYAPRFISPEERLRTIYAYYSRNPGDFSQAMERLKQSRRFMSGLTINEKNMIAQRHRFARDVKLLAFVADTLDHHTELNALQQTGDVVFPSGMRIHANPVAIMAHPELLSPLSWKKRKKIKDRVHELIVGEKRFILKERKTKFHTDTKKSGHRQGNTSESEFEIANQLRSDASFQQDRVELVWEKPLCCVEFPDGYSFVIFEYLEGLKNYSDSADLLVQAILLHKDEFREEYMSTNKGLVTFARSEQGKIFFKELLKKKGFLPFSKLVLKFVKVQALSYEEFARIKAKFLMNLAQDLYQQAFRKNNLHNSDNDGLAYRTLTNPRVCFQLVGMDFEYFISQDPEKAQETYGFLTALNSRYLLGEIMSNLDSLQEKLAELWMLEQVGMITIDEAILKKYGID